MILAPLNSTNINTHQICKTAFLKDTKTEKHSVYRGRWSHGLKIDIRIPLEQEKHSKLQDFFLNSSYDTQ